MELTNEEKNFIIRMFQTVTLSGNYEHIKQMTAMIEQIHGKLTAVPEQNENGAIEKAPEKIAAQ